MIAGMTHPPDPRPAPPDDGVLHKVRSLLAKAESTTFPDEAEALTAKAQQLMDRHAIDRAMLAAGGRDPGRPEGRDVTIDAPYPRPKFHLLGAVARANRCRRSAVPAGVGGGRPGAWGVGLRRGAPRARGGLPRGAAGGRERPLAHHRPAVRLTA